MMHTRWIGLRSAYWLLTVVLRLVALTGVIGCDRGPFSEKQPNIIFVLADDHAARAISAYGSEMNQTPHINRLADEGVLFENAFVTNSICAPSRAAFLTGTHSHVNGVRTNGEPLDTSLTTVPKLLQDAGYQTALFGKWHLRTTPTGFDTWTVLPGQGRYYNPEFRTPDGRIERTGYVTEIITDMTLDWLENERDPSEPFLLMYQHKAPHGPWDPAPEHLDTFADTSLPEPATLFEDYAGMTTAARWAAMRIGQHLPNRQLKLEAPGNLTPEQRTQWDATYDPRNEAFRKAELKGKELMRWKFQRYLKDYLRTVQSIDDNLGRVLDYLEEEGLAENTIVIYTSDQGFFLGEHGWYDKRWMYEESLRMPLLIRWPNELERGVRRDALVQNIDVAPTMLDAAGADIPERMQGRSLLPVLRGDTPDWRDAIYYHFYEFPGWNDVRRHYGIRTARYKLIHYYGIDEWEMFDLQTDPREENDIYHDTAHLPVRERLQDRLTSLREQVGADTIAQTPIPPDPRRVPLTNVLRYRFSEVQGRSIVNEAGRHGDAQLTTGKIAVRPEENTLELRGDGLLRVSPDSLDLDPMYRPLTVGGWIRPSADDGAIAAHGDDRFGWALYLQDGIVRFDVGRRPYPAPPWSIQSDTRIPLNVWTHVAATVGPFGELRLLINGEEVAETEGQPVVETPDGPVTIGGDVGDPVGGYQTPFHYRGELRDVRLYWGVLGAQAMAYWSDLGD